MATQLVTYSEVCEQLNRKYITIYGWVRTGKFPQPIRLNGRTVGFRRNDVEQWIEANAG